MGQPRAPVRIAHPRNVHRRPPARTRRRLHRSRPPTPVLHRSRDHLELEAPRGPHHGAAYGGGRDRV